MGLMRELGLIVHHLIAPVSRKASTAPHHDAAAEGPATLHRQTHREERAISATTTLRRTVIEEIEIKPAAASPCSETSP